MTTEGYPRRCSRPNGSLNSSVPGAAQVQEYLVFTVRASAVDMTRRTPAITGISTCVRMPASPHGRAKRPVSGAGWIAVRAPGNGQRKYLSITCTYLAGIRFNSGFRSYSGVWAAARYTGSHGVPNYRSASPASPPEPDASYWSSGSGDKNSCGRLGSRRQPAVGLVFSVRAGSLRSFEIITGRTILVPSQPAETDAARARATDSARK
jgi:hypothetical protein